MAAHSSSLLANHPYVQHWVFRAIDEERRNLFDFSLPQSLLNTLRPYIDKVEEDETILLSEILPITLRQELSTALAEQTHEWLPGLLLNMFEHDFISFLKPDEVQSLKTILSTATRYFYPTEKSRSETEDKSLQDWLTETADNVTPAALDHVRRWIELKQLSEEASLFLVNQLDPNNAYNPEAAYPHLIGEVPNREKRWKVLQGQMQLTITGHPTNADDTQFLRMQSQIAETALSWLTKKSLFDIEKARNRVRDAIGEFAARSPGTAKRTPSQEVDEMVWFCERVYYGLPVLMNEIYDSIQEHDPVLYNYCRRDLFPLTPIKLRSWIGADADGNPKIDDQATAESIVRSRCKIHALYLDEVAALIRLSAKPCDFDLRRILTTIERNLKQADPELIADTYPMDDLLEDLGKAYYKTDSGDIKKAVRHMICRVRTFGYYFAKIDTRQEPKVHAGILLAMIDADNVADEKLKNKCRGWVDVLSSQSPQQSDINCALDEIGQLPPEQLTQMFQSAERKLSEKDDVNPALATLRRLKLYKKYARSANGKWQRDQFNQYTISNCGEQWGMLGDVHTVDILMRAAGIDRFLRIVPLVETRRALQAVSDNIASLLDADWFQKSLDENSREFRLQVALSDTMRAHGPGAYVEQIEAGVNAILATLRYNRGKKSGAAPAKISVYYGGAMMDTMRGGGDQTSLMFRLRRDVEAAAWDEGFTQEEVTDAISSHLQQTRQGRDCYYLLGSPRRALQHLGITTSGVWHFLGFGHLEKSKLDLQRLHDERAATLEYRGWCQSVLTRYEHFFGPLLDHLAKNISPLFIYGVNAMNTSSRGERQTGFDKTTSFQATKVRAISGQIFFEKWGTYLPGWLGLSALQSVPLAERQRSFDISHIVREHLHRVNILLDKFDVSALWRELNMRRPQDDNEIERAAEQFERLIELSHDQQQHKIDQAAQNKKDDQDLLRAGVSWLEREYRRVTALNAETLYATQETVNTQLLDPNAALSYSPLIQEELNSTGASLRLLRALRYAVDQSTRAEDDKLALEEAIGRALHAGNRSGAFAANHNHGFGHSVAKSLKGRAHVKPRSTPVSRSFRHSLLARNKPQKNGFQPPI